MYRNDQTKHVAPDNKRNQSQETITFNGRLCVCVCVCVSVCGWVLSVRRSDTKRNLYTKVSNEIPSQTTENKYPQEMAKFNARKQNKKAERELSG